ncbi:protelomerase family protein [Acaryochloris sp. IP29b_bin.137]|uniref:protelomerase family protein n=1 Tax=Acaryochloris sp. IP29b_bin.137 TaxID=2969217 RepID=UPI0026368745|nr:protelomerase family protein [Acaryochloris sp. IP29b_bin.137]
MRRWLKKLYDHQFFPAVATLGNSPQDRQIAEQWASWMKQQWHKHGLKTLKQQRNLMTEVRQALKQQLGEEHVAVETMNFSRDEWIQINLSINDRVAARNEQQGLIEQPDAIVDRAKMLLDSRDWSEIAAGLAVITGRRCTELLQTAEFTYSSPYSVWFTGALKRRKEERELRFEIPTLAPAKPAIAALDILRQKVNTVGLDLETINRKYSPPVAKACDRYFAELVPQRAGRGTLYTHLFRTIYARIATHWYAPPSVADVEYMAAIQGHFLIQNEQDATLRRSLASTRHYNDYKIGDGQGNIDGRQGIRLRDPGVQVLQVFQRATPQLEPDPLTEWEEQPMIRPVKRQRPKREISTLRLYQDERDRWLQVLDQFEPRGTQQEKMSILLAWLEQSLKDDPPIHETPDDLDQLAHLFIEPLQPLRDPKAIRTLCQQEISDLEQDYYPEDYLPLYKRAIAEAIRSGQLPLIDGQTAERTSYTKEGVNYEQRTHYALLFLDDLNYELEDPKSDSLSQITPKEDGASSQAVPQSATDQKLDTLTTVLTQLVQAMQGGPVAPQPIPERENPQRKMARKMARKNGHAQQAEFPAPSPEPPPQNAKQSMPKKKGRRPGNTSAAAEAKIIQAINAIMDYNNDPTRTSDEKWMISASILKRLTKSYQGVIQRVLEAREDEIQLHHQAHGLRGRHNIRHGRAGVSIEQVIQLETE